MEIGSLMERISFITRPGPVAELPQRWNVLKHPVQSCHIHHTSDLSVGGSSPLSRRLGLGRDSGGPAINAPSSGKLERK